MNRPAWLILLCTSACGGCFKPEKPSLTSEDPSLKIPAILIVAEQHDENAVRQLVVDLDSDDPAVRFYAINALREITGKSFDYRYYHDEIRRRPALKRWQQWLDEREGTIR